MTVITIARSSTRDTLFERLSHFGVFSKECDLESESNILNCLQLALVEVCARKGHINNFREMARQLELAQVPLSIFKSFGDLAHGVLIRVAFDLDEVISTAYRTASSESWEGGVLGAFNNSIDYTLDRPNELTLVRLTHKWPEYLMYQLDVGRRVLEPIMEFTQSIGIEPSVDRRNVFCFAVRTAGAMFPLVVCQTDPKRLALFRRLSDMAIRNYLPGALISKPSNAVDYAR
ncbi:MAG: hypothetical protein AAF438_13030 [Pseudomonadota bacterium]